MCKGITMSKSKNSSKPIKPKLTDEEKIALGWRWVFTPYIHRRGKTIWHPTGVFKFLAPPR